MKHARYVEYKLKYNIKIYNRVVYDYIIYILYYILGCMKEMP